MPQSCIVKSCTVKYGQGKCMYRIPRDADTRNKWVEVLNRSGIEKVANSAVVCEDHFPPGSYRYLHKTQAMQAGKRNLHLRPDAVPVLDDPDQPSTSSSQHVPEQVMSMKPAVTLSVTNTAPWVKPAVAASTVDHFDSGFILQNDVEHSGTEPQFVSVGSQFDAVQKTRAVQTLKYYKKAVGTFTPYMWRHMSPMIFDPPEQSVKASESGWVVTSMEDMPACDAEMPAKNEDVSKKLPVLCDVRQMTNPYMNASTESFGTERKFLVFEKALDSLFFCLLCPTCGNRVSKARKKQRGTALTVVLSCINKHQVAKWSSQPRIRSISAGNILVAAATMYSGERHRVMADFAAYIGCCYISNKTFDAYRDHHLLPDGGRPYQNKRRAMMLSRLQEEDISITEDVCCDAPQQEMATE